MKKFFIMAISLLLCLLLLPAINAAAAGTPPEVKWYKTLDISIDGFQQTNDGGYILLSNKPNYEGILLTKADVDGNLLWQKDFQKSSYDYICSVHQTADGGYIISAFTYNEEAEAGDVWLIKTDGEGNKEWEKIFGEWEYEEEPGDAVQTADGGGYIVLGDTMDWEGNIEHFMWLQKTDASGNRQWQKTLATGQSEWIYMGYEVFCTADGGYIIMGKFENYNTGASNIILMKTDASGNKQWEKAFAGPEGGRLDSIPHLCLAPDGGYTIVATVRMEGKRYAYLMKTDANGNVEWEKTFGGTKGSNGKDVCVTTDGGYLIAGSISDAEEGYDAWLVKTNASGDQEWEMTFDKGDYDIGEFCQQTADGGYIVAGGTWLLKLAPLSPGLADLLPVGITTPNYIEAGQPAPVTVAVSNIGSSEASDFPVALYAGESLIETRNVSSLAAGASLNVDFTWTPSEAGEITLKAVVDPENSVQESNEANNEMTKAVLVSTTPLPDLKITSLSAGSAYLNRPVTITASVSNSGFAEASSFATAFYAGEELIDTKTVDSLATGASVDLNFTWTPSATGEIILKVVVDVNHAVNEANENNNERTFTVNVEEPPLSDLTVSQISRPFYIFPGTEASFTVALKNRGMGEACNFSVGFYVYQGDTLIFGQTQTVSYLAGAGTIDVAFNWTPPATGSYTLKAVADPENAIEETNETNNERILAISTTRDNWEQFQKDSINSGLSSEPTPLANITKEWGYQVGSTGSAGIGVAPLATDDKVFALDAFGGVWAFNAKTGEQLWKTDLSCTGMQFQLATPAYYGGKLYVATNDGHVYALNATSGLISWEKQVFSSTLSQLNTPVKYAGGKVYVGSWSSATGGIREYYCLDAADGTILWERESTSDGGYYWAGACIIGDYLLFGDDKGVVTCVHKDSKELVDEANLQNIEPTAGQIRSSITYNESTGRICFTEKGRCWAFNFNPDTGKLTYQWHTQIGYSTSTPAIYVGRVYVGQGGFGNEGKLYCLNETNGNEIWTFTPNGGVQSSPAISIQGDKHYIYFTSNCENGTAYCLDENGQELWHFTNEQAGTSGGYTLQGVAIYDGMVYFGNDGGYLYALVQGEAPVGEHTLTTAVDPAGSGTVELNPPGGAYPAGTTVTLTANPAAGDYAFDHWSGDLSGNANPAAITMDADKSVTAHFVAAGPQPDVNNDGQVNVLDMVLIGQKWGQTGDPGWIKEDVNQDGKIDVLDLILVGQHWTG